MSSFAGRRLALLALAVILPLGGCAKGGRRSWWETANITIAKGATFETMEAAVASADENVGKPVGMLYSFDHVEHYKDYLGPFATEVDKNCVHSLSAETDKYENDVVVAHYSRSEEDIYLNARRLLSEEMRLYSVGTRDDLTVLTRTFEDYGDGTENVHESLRAYADEEEFDGALSIGANIDLHDLSMGNTITCGYADNGQLIIEAIRIDAFGGYVPAFTGETLRTVENRYLMYRLAAFTDDGGETAYYVDYSYEKITLEIGEDIEGEPLDAPFTLEQTEAAFKYRIGSNGTYDVSSIPATA